ncbi:hypothetical protein PM01_10990 [Sulfitobacter pontiacus 3SOLIMAR09]|nr:hypothetical protein PM01_10990 [Sulfitobacter pontiacus 3SOLIMAR09]
MLLKPLPNFLRATDINGSAVVDVVVSRKVVPISWLVAEKSVSKPIRTGLVVHGKPVNGRRTGSLAK